MRSFSKFLAVVAGVAFAASLAFAANQNILGKILSVKQQKPGDTGTRKITGIGKEKSSNGTLVGNPTIPPKDPSSIDGAFLDVFANAEPGGTSSSQRFSLPHGSWTKIDDQGFKYNDPKGANGPVKSAIIKRTKSGVFLIKAKITAKNGTVDVFPPDPGDSGCVALELGPGLPSQGARYSVQFNNTGNNVTNVDGKLFKVKKPTDDSTACPQVTPTTTTSSTSAAPTTTTSSTSVTPTTTTSSTSVTPTTTTSSSTGVPPTTTTSTTLYGSPSRAFLAASADLLD
jgi:hypothetical protein